jgi:hypothetical protein
VASLDDVGGGLVDFDIHFDQLADRGAFAQEVRPLYRPPSSSSMPLRSQMRRRDHVEIRWSRILLLSDTTFSFTSASAEV